MSRYNKSTPSPNFSLIPVKLAGLTQLSFTFEVVSELYGLLEDAVPDGLPVEELYYYDYCYWECYESD